MRVRCLVAEAAQYWEYRPGLVYEVPDAVGEMLIRAGKAERADTTCPHCGGNLTSTPEGSTEAAVLPRARARG